jgi:hypothetical protein
MNALNVALFGVFGASICQFLLNDDTWSTFWRVDRCEHLSNGSFTKSLVCRGSTAGSFFR